MFATRSMPRAETRTAVSAVHFVLRPGEVPADDERIVLFSSDFKSSLVDKFWLQLTIL
jgi:hypothetical protein